MSDKPEEPSEEFQLAFTGGGTIAATCGFCGTTYFATYANEGCFENGELEELRMKAEKEPKRYVECDYSSVSIGWIDGKQYVADCCCNHARKYEDWIWGLRYQLTSYINNRIEREKRDAILQAEQLKIKETPCSGGGGGGGRGE